MHLRIHARSSCLRPILLWSGQKWLSAQRNKLHQPARWPIRPILRGWPRWPSRWLTKRELLFRKSLRRSARWPASGVLGHLARLQLRVLGDCYVKSTAPPPRRCDRRNGPLPQSPRPKRDARYCAGSVRGIVSRQRCAGLDAADINRATALPG